MPQHLFGSAAQVLPAAEPQEPVYQATQEAFASQQEENAFLHAVIDHFPGGIMVYDKNLRLVLCNQRQKELLEYPPYLFDFGMPTLEQIFRFNAVRGEYGPGDIEAKVAERMALAAKREAHVFRRMRPNGVMVEVRGVPLPNGGFVTTYLDITTRETQRVQAPSANDRGTTPILDWPAFVEKCDGMLAARSFNRNYAFHYIDINGYKAVKDTYGETVARTLIKTVGERIAQSVRNSDVVGYIGEDEFAVLQTGITRPSDVTRLEAAMVALTRNPFSIGPTTISGRISVGIALSPRDGFDVETLRNKARASMERARAE